MRIQKIIPLTLAGLLALSLAGCVPTGTADSPAGATNTENINSRAISTETPTYATSADTLTKVQAIAIALEHAGLTEADITGLWAEYEIDDGVPEYDVEFHHGNYEYSYDIHAVTGEIRAYSRED